MRKTLKIVLIIFLLMVVLIVGFRTFSNEDDWICVNGDWIKHGNPSTPMPAELCDYESNVGAFCQSDTQCNTPMEFLLQSNCPFSSACIDSKCVVVCPLFEQNCSSVSDCDCSWRGNRTLECLCLGNGCFSVEDD